MTNADLFKEIFGFYATEIWAKSEQEFLDWIKSPTQMSGTSDAVSRQAAIDAMAELQGRASSKTELKGISKAWKRIKALPSVKPERKNGKWVPMFDGQFKGGAYWFSCSECERIVPDVRNGGWYFCPKCGTDMRGEADGV